MNTKESFEPTSGFRYIEVIPEAGESNGFLIFLHGSGERGADINAIWKFGLPALLRSGAITANVSMYFPLLQEHTDWVAEDVCSFIRYQILRHDGLSALVGYSLGASAVCEIVARFGAVVDCAVAIAGQATLEPLVPQDDVRFLSVEGEFDSWASTSNFVKSVASKGGDATHVVLPGKDHYIADYAMTTEIVRSTLPGCLALTAQRCAGA